MSETEHEHATGGTGDATTAGDDAPEAGDDAATRTTETTSATTPEGEAEGEAGPFGGLTPGEASRLRWEKARERAANPATADPRIKMAQGLQKKAESGDLRAYEAWKAITDELERERLSRDHADGAEAWEDITPAQRRLLLSVLEGDSVVLSREEHDELQSRAAAATSPALVAE